MDDLRYQWFKEIIYKTLSIDFNDSAFDEMLEKDKIAHDYLSNFILESNNIKSCIFFYYTVEEVEIEVQDSFEPKEESEKIEVSELSESEKLDSENASVDDRTEGLENDDVIENTLPKTDSFDDVPKSEVVSRRGLSRRSTTSLLQTVQKNVLHACSNIATFVPSQRYVYFLKRKLDSIPKLETAEEAFDIMKNYFEIGSINQHPLIAMNKIISHIYSPILKNKEWISQIPPKECKLDENQLLSVFKKFHIDIEEFLKATEETISHIETPDLFNAPNIMTDCTPEELAQEGSFVIEAEELVNEWTDKISGILERAVQERPPDNNLLGEINFWKRQKFTLSTCYDNVSKTSIQQTLEILKIANSDISTFEEKTREVEKYLEIASDNFNYLSLLEPHAKNLLPEKPFEDAQKAIEGILLLLKMIWIQSKYFKEVSNMCRLIKGIAVLLKEKVKINANVEKLFRKPMPEIKRIITSSIQLLKFWKQQYLKECENVKKYGGSYWWGFEINVFFTETDHMILVCTDLEKVTMMLDELYNIFNTNLKYFVQDVKGLKILELRVFGITSRIQYANFDVFDPAFKPQWSKIIQTFLRDVSNFEDEIKMYISKMFRSTLSWENAYILTKSFGKIAVSPGIRDFIDKSRDDMLKQFISEIYEKENEFLLYKDEPPHYQGIPEVISSIIWVQNLVSKLSKPVSQICDHTDLSKKESEVMERFKKTEMLLKEHKLQKYEAWKVSANDKLNKFLQEKVLKIFKQSSNDFEKVLTYQVNFPIYLEDVSIEAKLLEFYGFEIPVFIRNVIMQEKLYYDYRHEIRMTLENLKKCVSTLDDDEISILGIPIENLCSVLDLGLNTIQWESSSVADYVKKVKRAVAVFTSLINQIQIVFTEIDKRIESLSQCDLFLFSLPDDKEVLSCEEFFENAEIVMEERVKKVTDIHASLHFLLKNLEKITCKTSTGAAIHMKQYYQRCEKHILMSLLKMTLLNMEYFKDEIMENYIFPYVKLIAKAEDEFVKSSLDRAKLIFLTFLRNAIESTRKVPRWLDGTCISSPTFYLEDTKEQMEFSYYLDICMHPHIKNVTLNILNNFFNYIDKLNEF